MRGSRRKNFATVEQHIPRIVAQGRGEDPETVRTFPGGCAGSASPAMLALGLPKSLAACPMIFCGSQYSRIHGVSGQGRA